MRSGYVNVSYGFLRSGGGYSYNWSCMTGQEITEAHYLDIYPQEVYPSSHYARYNAFFVRNKVYLPFLHNPMCGADG